MNESGEVHVDAAECKDSDQITTLEHEHKEKNSLKHLDSSSSSVNNVNECVLDA